MTYNVTATGYGDTVKFYVDAEDIKEAYEKGRKEAEEVFHVYTIHKPHPDPNVQIEIQTVKIWAI